ncbi:MAG TPA: TonB-dependent receptor plug domain-containing protein [Opitutaceae bacterium]|nr:TonB-dependent receptor plug domain-containing protein [Opitutaceae bacterium]
MTTPATPSVFRRPANRTAAALLWASALLVSVAPIQAQTATAATDDQVTAPAPGQPLLLDPFQVSTDKDEGYLANSTLSGTLFNTQLKDNAASIEVFTPQFIQDVGAFNIKELAIYGQNTVLDLDESAAGGANGNALNFYYNQFRVRGQDISQSVDYFLDANLPIDMYNIERVEESRGPNSVLFGIGSPSGVLNYTTKTAVIGKSFGDVVLTAGSWGTRRATLDFNQSLLHDTLAIRLNLLADHEGNYGLYSDADSKAGTAEVTYRVTSKIELRGSFEAGTRLDEPTAGQPLKDLGYIEWNALGRPLYGPGAVNPDPFNWGNKGTAGTYNAPSAVQFVSLPGQPLGSGQIINENGQLFGDATANVSVSGVYPQLSSPLINPNGPDARRHTTWESNSAYADIQLAPRIFLQASFNHLQDQFHAWNNIHGDNISADMNQFLPNGQPNPNAGKVFFSGTGATYNADNVFDRGRLLISAEEDFGKWFGHYHAAVSAQQDDDASTSPSYQEAWVGEPFGGTPESRNNEVVRRNYVVEGDWSTYFLNVSGNKNALIHNMVDPSTGQSFSSTMVPSYISSNRSQERDLMGVVQAQYFDDILDINAGARRDTFTEFSRGLGRNATTNYLQEDPAAGTESSQGGNTTSVGAVVHAVRSKYIDFDLLANKSDNFSLAQAGLYELSGNATGQTSEALPAAKGKGSEWGFAITLLDGMFYLKAVHFHDKTLNLFNYIGVDAVGYKNHVILGDLVSQGYITQETADSRDTQAVNVYSFDQVDDGNEISLTANLTKNWRFQANFSENNPTPSNVESGDAAFWNKVLKPYYNQFPTNISIANDPLIPGATIAQEEANTDMLLAQDQAVEGKGIIGFRKYKWNFFTRYTFSRSFLKGFYVGGGYIWQSHMIIGTYPDGSLLYNGNLGTASALVGYETHVAGHPVRLQLNVSNLFNDTDAVIVRKATDTYYLSPGLNDYLLPQQEYYPNPRAWRLSADFSF